MHDGIKQFIPTSRRNDKLGNVKKNFQPFSANLKSLINQKHQLWNRWISSRKEAVYKKYKVFPNKVKVKWPSLCCKFKVFHSMYAYRFLLEMRTGYQTLISVCSLRHILHINTTNFYPLSRFRRLMSVKYNHK